MYEVDVERTRIAYLAEAKGKADSCGCSDCQNFRAARDQIFSGGAGAFMSNLGIDIHKDGENYRLIETAPGLHKYEGWFHFVGSLKDVAKTDAVHIGDNISVFMCQAYAPHLRSLDGLPLVQVEFSASNVPWTVENCEPSF
jgi:hypothetical protein